MQAYLLRQGENSVSGAHEAVGLLYQQLLRQASALSYLDGFRVMAVLLLLTVPAVWIMRKPHFKSQQGSAE